MYTRTKCMQNSLRKIFTPKLKVKIALEAIKAEKTIAQISGLYGVHPTQINAWKKKLLKGSEDVFSQKRKKKEKNKNEFINALYERIGKKDVEIAFLKKNIGIIDN